MKSILISFFSILVLINTGCEEKRTAKANSVSSDQGSAFNAIPVLENVTAPVFLTHAGDDRVFIVQQPGMINILKNGKLLPEPFLDISSKVETGRGYSEKGLLGLAFHPQYNSNGRFFIYYSSSANTKKNEHRSVLAEYKVSPDNSNRAVNQEKLVMEIPQPESNHNGGMIEFGPDGYLYIGLGDGGGAGDEHGKYGNAKDLSSLLGKMLRIDVDKNSASPYSIPKDNPFINTPNARPEIFALGLRNPWRFSFDDKTQELFCGDVGQNEWEEIDIIRKGGNYGWRALEAEEVYDPELRVEDAVTPVHSYPHSVGISVIGGYVYRGSEFTEWDGRYFFADWNGKVFYLKKNQAGKWIRHPLAFNGGSGFTINSFGKDSKGELYLLGQQQVGPNSKTGRIYKLASSKIK